MTDRKQRLDEEVPLTFTEPQAAKLIGISVRTLQRLRVAGDIEYMRIGNRILYRRSQIESLFVASSRGGSDSRLEAR